MLNPLCPLSTLLSHTGTKAIACKIRGQFISVETEVLLANLITLSQTKHKLCPSRADALAIAIVKEVRTIRQFKEVDAHNAIRMVFANLALARIHGSVEDTKLSTNKQREMMLFIGT